MAVLYRGQFRAVYKSAVRVKSKTGVGCEDLENADLDMEECPIECKSHNGSSAF